MFYKHTHLYSTSVRLTACSGLCIKQNSLCLNFTLVYESWSLLNRLFNTPDCIGSRKMNENANEFLIVGAKLQITLAHLHCQLCRIKRVIFAIKYRTVYVFVAIVYFHWFYRKMTLSKNCRRIRLLARASTKPFLIWRAKTSQLLDLFGNKEFISFGVCTTLRTNCAKSTMPSLVFSAVYDATTTRKTTTASFIIVLALICSVNSVCFQCLPECLRRVELKFNKRIFVVCTVVCKALWFKYTFASNFCYFIKSSFFYERLNRHGCKTSNCCCRYGMI